MKWIYWIALIALLAGIGSVIASAGFPVYSDEAAPGRLSFDLQNLPREIRFEEWHRQLKSFETPHKRLNDLGWGLIASAAGFGLAAALWRRWHRSPAIRHTGMVMLIWFALWLLRIPLVFRYYMKRQERFDYPVWGDSIGIPIYSEIMALVVLAVLSAMVLAILRINHPLPAVIGWTRPLSAVGWIRAVVLGFWILMLAFGILMGIWDGNEGTVLASLPAGVILIAFLTSVPESGRGAAGHAETCPLKGPTQISGEV